MPFRECGIAHSFILRQEAPENESMKGYIPTAGPAMTKGIAGSERILTGD